MTFSGTLFNSFFLFFFPPRFASHIGMTLYEKGLFFFFPFPRGDQTSAEAYLTVLPRAMECVVFSIDGSFAASVSIMGSDPKVRPGAVDVVRQVLAAALDRR